ncbi:MAG TPA: ATP-binding protein, partial [Thermoanaerobaculia bacterium]
ATSAGLVLLFLYVPHILRPIEAMLDEARELGEHRGDADEAAYLIDTFRNSIATLKTQEAELKRLHEFEKTRADDLQTITSTLTRSLSSGFIALGPDDRVVDANVAAREILELPRETALADRAIDDAFGDNAFAESLADAAARREALTRHEIELARADGTPKIIGLTTVPLLSAADRFLGTLALFTELTQVRRLESRVRELQTLADLGVMSAGIAHEFRNSLSTILGMVKLARRTEVSSEVDRRLAAVETEANQLAAAVTSLLQFARPMRLQLAETDLRELLETQVARLRESEPAVEFTFDAEPATIRGDATILARAFDNLLRNAIDAVGENDARRAVSVTVRGGDEPVVEIADNGNGIDETDRANLFLPFHSTKPNGVGLGLPLARKIVLLHGGTIAIQSRRGEGTTVRVSLAAQPDVASPV